MIQYANEVNTEILRNLTSFNFEGVEKFMLLSNINNTVILRTYVMRSVSKRPDSVP